jgi:hypothetical protein
MPRLLPLLLLAIASTALAQKPYRLSSVDLKQRVIWGSEATSPEGFTLAFGGMDQENLVDGNPHTRVKREGKWETLYREAENVLPVDKDLKRFEYLARKSLLLGSKSQPRPGTERKSSLQGSSRGSRYWRRNLRTPPKRLI